MPHTYERMVHFADTDAAGVVFFANYLRFCHEAYEETLAAAGIPMAGMFADTGTIIPVVKSEVEYLRSLKVGDRVRIVIEPALLSENSFALTFTMTRLAKPEKVAARARTEHVSISTTKRERAPLSPALTAWLRQGSAA